MNTESLVTVIGSFIIPDFYLRDRMQYFIKVIYTLTYGSS